MANSTTIGGNGMTHMKGRNSGDDEGARTAAAAKPEDATTDEPPAPACDVLTVDELARLLRINRKTAYNAISRNEIPGVRRIGHAIRASRSAVLAWLAQGQRRADRSEGGRR